MSFGTSLSKLTDEFKDFFWAFGYFGWQLATIYALYVAYGLGVNYMVLFIIFFLLSGLLNHSVLKKFIKDLRPLDSAPFIASEKFRKRTNGMPSGHAQQTAFALTFAYLLTNKFFYLSILIFVLTVVQRYVFKNHTLPQLLAGGVLGCGLGFGSFFLLKFLVKPLEKIESQTFKDIRDEINSINK
jgi:membrane-associated phospholipid phosphatase